MRVNYVVFWVLAAFMTLADVLYTAWSVIATGGVEWVGTVAMGLSALLGAFLAFYLGMVHRAQGGELPEDRLDSDIDDGDPEMGFYSPWSWWPVFLGGAFSLFMLGLAVGFWICFIGAALVAVGVIGWVFEYYRGFFAR